MSGSNDGSGSWSSRFMKVASAAAATAAVAGGLYAILSSSTSASSEMEVLFGSARRESKERDDGGSGSRPREVATTVSWKKPEIGWVELNVDGEHEETEEADNVKYSIAIARSLYGNTKRQESLGEHEETEDDEETEEADNVKWKKPESGWVKLNVDGSRIHKESAGCGGVIRDEWGTWGVGFSKKLDPNYEAQQTELQAILTGLKVAWDVINVEKLVVESDNNDVVKMVNGGLESKCGHPYYEVVQDINELLKANWRLEYVPRKANRLADNLAKRACKPSSPRDLLCKYPDPPDSECRKIYLEDNN